ARRPGTGRGHRTAAGHRAGWRPGRGGGLGDVPPGASGRRRRAAGARRPGPARLRRVPTAATHRARRPGAAGHGDRSRDESRNRSRNRSRYEALGEGGCGKVTQQPGPRALRRPAPPVLLLLAALLALLPALVALT